MFRWRAQSYPLVYAHLDPAPGEDLFCTQHVSELATMIASCKSQIIAFVTHVHICFTFVWKLLIVWMSSGVLDTPLQLSSCPSLHCPQGFYIEVNDDTEMKLVTQFCWLPAHACIKNMVIKDLLWKYSWAGIHQKIQVGMCSSWRLRSACTSAQCQESNVTLDGKLRLWSDSEDAHTDLNLFCMYISTCTSC